jgi:magnesium transporter
MNFSRINPETGEVMKSNMPELYHPYGYVGVWIFMILVAIFQIFVYYKAGWILSGRKKKG